MLRKMGHGACEFDHLCAVSDVGGRGAHSVRKEALTNNRAGVDSVFEQLVP